MFGAVIGDIAGSRFEWNNVKTKDFELFAPRCSPTDDSIMTLAIARALLLCDGHPEKLGETAVRCMREAGRRYPHLGYGQRFHAWLMAEKPQPPYQSFGNGAAMRVSACGFAASSLSEALDMARRVTEVTHDHPEGIRGAQATAAVIWLARQRKSMDEIREHVRCNYYPLDTSLEQIRPGYTFDVSCQGSVPQAIEAFLEAEGFEDAIRNAISLGGDSDTLAAIAGSMAEAKFGVPEALRIRARFFLDEDMLAIIKNFENRFGLPGNVAVS